MEYISFNSLNYIIFLIICVLIYYAVPAKVRWSVLLLASIAFYFIGGMDKFAIPLSTSAVIWGASYGIHKLMKQAEDEAAEQKLTGKARLAYIQPFKKKCRNFILIPALIIVFGFLFYCKFANMIVSVFQEWTHTGQLTLKLLIPLGISYYTFSSVGYLLDVYWRKQPFISNYFKFLLCMCYFPPIVQGPIGRYHKLKEQFDRANYFDYEKICFGIQLMLYGYFKKLVIADRLALLTTAVLQNIGEYEGIMLFLALIGSSLQLYMDFSGCMDIVRGTSQIFGIELEKNFNHPFFSRNVAEFWRRWHITLGVWFKDYVYMPIAMSPKLLNNTKKIKEKYGANTAKVFSTAVPLTIVWLLTGIWHGTGMNYVLWGMYYGVIIILSTALAVPYKNLASRLRIDVKSTGFQRFQMVRTFFLFTVGRLITAPGTLAASISVIRQMFSSFNPWIFWDGTLYSVGLDFKDYLVIILGLLFVWKISRMQEQGSVRSLIAQKNIVLRWLIYYVAIFSIILLGMYGTGYDARAFAYTQF